MDLGELDEGPGEGLGRDGARMGCVASKLDINDVHPNMFAVNNVDDVSTDSLFSPDCPLLTPDLQMGVKLNSGQLEITEVELVLHRRGKQPVKWPLRCADASVF